jgi:hypothetical protein
MAPMQDGCGRKYTRVRVVLNLDVCDACWVHIAGSTPDQDRQQIKDTSTTAVKAYLYHAGYHVDATLGKD